MQITRGKINTGIKTVIYGPEGIGKTTLAAQFPGAVFIDTEGSTKHMDVARLPEPTSWQMLMEEATWAKDHPKEVGTLVIDTADWAETMEIKELCAKKHWDGLEDAGYGKGYTYSAEEFGKLLNTLNEAAKNGINIVITAHAWMRKVELPEAMGAYDHWEMKTSKKVAPMIREWADMVLFLNYKTILVNVDGKGQAKGKNKAQGGRRVMYTNHTPFWDAKNRFGLPDEMPLSYDGIRHVFEKAAAPAPEPVQEPEYKVSEPAPKAKEDNSNLKGFVAEEDLFFKMGEEIYWIKKGQVVPADVIADGKQITKLEYAKIRKARERAAEARDPTPTVTSKDDLNKVQEEFQEPDPRIPKKLRDLMMQDKIDEWDIQNLVGSKGYFPADMKVSDYPGDFIDGWCIAYWPQVKESVMEARKKQEIEFN